MKIVPSLELCQKMRELGYQQRAPLTKFYLIKIADVWIEVLWSDNRITEYLDHGMNDYVLAAPMVEEMVEWLRNRLPIEYLEIRIDKKHPFRVFDSSINMIIRPLFEADTLSNAVSKVCIWVLEQKGWSDEI